MDALARTRWLVSYNLEATLTVRLAWVSRALEMLRSMIVQEGQLMAGATLQPTNRPITDFEAEVAMHTAVSMMASSYDRHLEDVSKPFCSPKRLRHAVLVRLIVWWHEKVMAKDLRKVDLSPVFKSEVSASERYRML